MPIEIRYDAPGALIGASYEAGQGLGLFEARKAQADLNIRSAQLQLEQNRIDVQSQGQALSYAAQLASIRSHEAQQARALEFQAQESDANRQFQAEQNALRMTAEEERLHTSWDLQNSYQINLLRERQRIEEQDRQSLHNERMNWVEEARRNNTLDDEQYAVARREAMLGGDPSKLQSLQTRPISERVTPYGENGTLLVEQPNGVIDVKVGAKGSLKAGQDDVEGRYFSLPRADGTTLEGIALPNGDVRWAPKHEGGGRDREQEAADKFMGDFIKSHSEMEPEEAASRAQAAYSAFRRARDMEAAGIPMPPASEMARIRDSLKGRLSQLEAEAADKDKVRTPAQIKAEVNAVRESIAKAESNMAKQRPATFPSRNELPQDYERRVMSLRPGDAYWNPAVREWRVFNPAAVKSISPPQPVARQAPPSSRENPFVSAGFMGM